MSIILDALRKAEEEKKLQQSSQKIDITRQILNSDKRASQGSSSPVNKAVLAGVAIAITGLAALGIYSSLTALKKERPVERASTAPGAAPSPVVKTKPAPEDARVAPPPAQTVVAAPSAPPKAKTAPAPSAAAVARTPAPKAAAGHSVPPKAKTAPPRLRRPPPPRLHRRRARIKVKWENRLKIPKSPKKPPQTPFSGRRTWTPNIR